MNFTLVQLRYFVAAAEQRSMTAASRELVVAQSAVSSAVAHLEREFKVQLLVRHHAKGLSLTPSGERFLTEARELLARAADLAAGAQELGGSLVGRLSVGCFVTLAPFVLPGLLSGFADRHPGVSVRLLEDETASLQAALLAGRCELALLYDLGLSEELEVERLARARPYAIVGAGHPLAGRGRVPLRLLVPEPMVLLDLPHSRDYGAALAARTGQEPTVAHRSTSFEMVRAMVAAGHGFAILNQRPAHDLTYDGGRVAVLELDSESAQELPSLPVVLARARAVRPTRRAEAFADACRGHFREREAAGEPEAAGDRDAP